MGLTIKKHRSFKKAAGIFTVAMLLTASAIGLNQYRATHVLAADPTPTPESYFTFDDATGTITAYNWTDGPKDLVIPRTIGGVAVTTLGGTMATGGGLTSVFIPDSVTSINDGAFSGNDITAITIPESVTTIGAGAFGQNDITDLFIPNSVTTIGLGAFDNNPLVNVTIGSADYGGTPTLDILGNFSMSTIENVVIGNNVRSINNGSFSNTSVGSLDLGDSIQTISGGAFGSNLLTSVYIPDSVTTLGGGAFGFSEQLVSIQIGSDSYSGPANLVLSGGVFSYTPKLETLKFGNTLNTLTSGVFSGNTALRSLDLGESVTTINSGALQSVGITEVTLPASLTTLSGGVFSGSTNLKKVTFMGPTTIEASFYGTSLEEIYFNDDATIDEWVVEALTEVIGVTGKYIRVYAASESDWFSAPDLASVYIVNPAEVFLRYLGPSGNNLAPEYYALSDSLTDYSVAANPTADFSLYYRAGNSLKLDPPTIAGYVTPEAKTFVLGAGINNLTYSYQPVGLPDTGSINLVTYLVSILGLTALAYGLRRVV